MMTPVINAFGLNEKVTKIDAFGNGLINRTWKLISPEGEYILQQINESVFSNPTDIAHNIKLLSEHLQKHHPEYFFVTPLSDINGDQLFYFNQNYYRVFPFVKDSHSKDVVNSPAQAYEAAKSFGRFCYKLRDFNPSDLKITIPHFHDLSLRYQQFRSAIRNGDAERIQQSAELINALQKHSDIVSEYEKISRMPEFKLRVMHLDTKISNVLFNDHDKAICVIDLDTVMPGYFFSDLGDMMRTYLSPAGEEENDINKIEVRTDFYKAIVEGYAEEMKDELSELEKQNFFYAGKFMIYMQSLRFLTDHLNLDVYYGAKYPHHNFFRARNQITLLKKYIEMNNE